jgi:hypothetical protein
MLQGLKFEASSLMNFVQIEIAIGIEIVLAVEVSFEVSFLFDPDFDFDFDLDCPASSLKPHGATAIHSISTAAPFGSAATCTQARAGGTSVKNSP